MQIDELVIALSLDPTKFTKGQKDALAAFKKTGEQARATAKSVEADGGKAAEFFSKIKGEALALGAVLIGANGLRDYVGKTVGGLVQLGIAAGNMGLAAREVSAFQAVMQRSGDTAEGALASLQKVAQAQQAWRMGMLTDVNYMRAMGQIGGQATDDPIAIYEKFSKWAAGQKDRQRVTAFGGWLGFNEAETAAATRGPGVFRAEMAQGRANAPTDADIKAAQELNAAWKELGQTIQSLARGPMIEFLHNLTGALNDLDKLGREGKRNATGNPFLDTWNGLTGRHDGVASAAGGAGGHASTALMWGRTGLAPAATADARAQQIKAYYQSRGWSATAAAGIAAGIGAETGGSFDSRIKNPTSTAFGLGQWTKSSGRWDTFKKYFHKDIHDATYEEQLAFLNLEMTHLMRGSGNAIARSKDSRGAASAYINQMMRPGAAGAALDMRNASVWLSRLGAGGAGGGTTVYAGDINVYANTNDPRAHGAAVREALQQTAVQANRGPS